MRGNAPQPFSHLMYNAASTPRSSLNRSSGNDSACRTHDSSQPCAIGGEGFLERGKSMKLKPIMRYALCPRAALVKTARVQQQVVLEQVVRLTSRTARSLRFPVPEGGSCRVVCALHTRER